MQEPLSPNNQALAKLVWQTPDRKEHEYFFGQETITIGRSEGNDVVLSNSCVSRCHAKIHWKEGNFFISDMESANGTFVNDQWIKGEHRLQDSDRINLWFLELYFHSLTPEESMDNTVTAVLMGERPAVQPRLVINAGPQEGQEFVLSKKETIIGRASRHSTCDIALEDRTVSRRHTRISKTTRGFVLADMGSANGTFANGRRIIEPRLLKNGDLICLGESFLVFLSG
jgi:pSer/pThr/pTyr-binding forkhead associated (FHA) protein